MGISPREQNGNPLQYSWQESPIRQRSLVGYSPWGRKVSDTTEHAHTNLWMGNPILLSFDRLQK